MGNDELERVEQMEVSFSCTDEFGQKSEYRKTLNTDACVNGMDIDLLLEQFKMFLLGTGFTTECVSKIQYVEN